MTCESGTVKGFFADSDDENDLETTYKIIRFYRNDLMEDTVITRGLTLEEAREHCNDPNTKTEDYFDGYTSE